MTKARLQIVRKSTTPDAGAQIACLRQAAPGRRRHRTLPVLALTTFALLLATPPVQAASCAAPPAALAAEMLAAVNAARAQAGQNAFAPDPRLSQVAQHHACEMAAQGTVSHTGQNGSRVSDRVKAAGFRTCLTAENIGFGLATVSALMQTLMASPPHRANILNRRLQAAGFGYVPASGGSGPWWVQVYADPC